MICCVDFEILLISIIYEIPIFFFQNVSKCFLMVTNTESLYATFEFGDPPATANLLLISYNSLEIVGILVICCPKCTGHVTLKICIETWSSADMIFGSLVFFVS